MTKETADRLLLAAANLLITLDAITAEEFAQGFDTQDREALRKVVDQAMAEEAGEGERR